MTHDFIKMTELEYRNEIVALRIALKELLNAMEDITPGTLFKAIKKAKRLLPKD